MRKIAVILSALCALAFAQRAERKLVVVSVSGSVKFELAEDLMEGISYALSKKRLYDLLPNDKEFRDALKKEWNGGMIADERIIALAKNANADYLCFAKVTSRGGEHRITARLINLKKEPMTYGRMGKAESDDISKTTHITKLSKELVDDMLEGVAAESASAGSSGGGASPLAHEGKTYKTVKMPDGKTWMAENMNDAAGKSACYQNSEANCQRCGRLYDWATATMICPSGWHLPSDAEWTALENASGGSTAGTALKSKSGWSSDGNGMDKHGFSALPCGFRSADGSFYNYGSLAYFWSATESGSGNAWLRDLGAGDAIVRRINRDKAILFSVRCVRD